MNESSLPRRRLVIGAVALLLVAIACTCSAASGIPGLSDPTPTPIPPTDMPVPTDTPAPTEQPTERPTARPTREPRPTESGGGSGGSDGIRGGGITLNNVENIEEKWYDNVGAAMMAASASPVDHLIATFSGDNLIRMWDGDTGSLLWDAPTTVRAWGLAFSPDGSVIAVGAGFHLLLYDAYNGGAPLRDFVVNADIFRIIWTPDNEALAVVGSRSSRIFVVDAMSGDQGEIPGLTNLELWSLSYSRNERYLATGNVDGDVLVIDLEAEEIAFDNRNVAEGAAWDVEFSPNSDLLASCNTNDNEGNIYIWDATTWNSTPLLRGPNVHPGGCLDGTFSADGTVYFSAGYDGYVNMWNSYQGGDSVFGIDAGGVGVYAVTVTGDGELLALVMDDGGISVWQVP